MNFDNQRVKKRPLAPEVLLGIGLGFLLHVIQIPIAVALFWINLDYFAIQLCVIGVSQLVYIVPAIVIYLHKKRSGIVIGLIVIAAITILFNAALFGLIILMNPHR
jgi:hypothetical protein